MDGAPDGNTGTGTVEVKVVDINDNAPKLEKDQVSTCFQSKYIVI